MLGNKESVRLSDGAGEAQKLDEFVLTTAFIMRLFIFILLGAQVDFTMIGRYWLGGVAVVSSADAGGAAGDGIPVCIARSPRPLELCARCCSCAGRARPASFRRRWPACCSGMKAPGAPMIDSVTFIAILMTILIQAPTTEWLARKLGLLHDGES